LQLQASQQMHLTNRHAYKAEQKNQNSQHKKEREGCTPENSQGWEATIQRFTRGTEPLCPSLEKPWY